MKKRKELTRAEIMNRAERAALELSVAAEQLEKLDPTRGEGGADVAAEEWRTVRERIAYASKLTREILDGAADDEIELDGEPTTSDVPLGNHPEAL